MRIIELKTRPAANGKDEEWADKGLLEPVIRHPIGGPGRGGTLVDMMRLDLTLIAALEAGKGKSIALEEPEWSHLCNKLKVYPWGVADSRIIAMTDDILNAPKQTPDSAIAKAKRARSR